MKKASLCQTFSCVVTAFGFHCSSDATMAQAPMTPMLNPTVPFVAFDSTFDRTSFGSSFDVNTLLPIGGHLNESGLRLRITGATSYYRFMASPDLPTLLNGKSDEIDVLIGYQAIVTNLSILFAAGPVYVESRDETGSERKLNGGKVVFTAYATPTKNTMFFARSTYLTIGNAFDLQMKVGARIANIGYFGPDFKLSARDAGGEYRFGPHLSGIVIGPLSLSLSAGWAKSQRLGLSNYFNASVYVPF